MESQQTTRTLDLFFAWIDEFEERQYYECKNTYQESFFEMILIEKILKQIDMMYFSDPDDLEINEIKDKIVRLNNQSGIEATYIERHEQRLILTNRQFNFIQDRMFQALMRMFKEGVFSSIIQEMKEKGQDRLASRLKPKFTEFSTKEFKDLFDHLLTEHAAKQIILYCILQQNLMNFTDRHFDFIKDINYLTHSIFDQSFQLVNSLQIQNDFIVKTLKLVIEDTIAEAEIEADNLNRIQQQNIYHTDTIMKDEEIKEEEFQQQDYYDDVDDDDLEEIARQFNEQMNQ